MSPLKGTINKDHMPVNKFTLLVLGMPDLTFTEISGIEEELETTDLPDRTRASGGNTLPIEFTAKMPLHHTAEQAAMELWFSASQDPVSDDYEKEATLICQSVSGAGLRTFSLIDLFPRKRGLPDLDIKNEGEMAEVEWTFSANDILPI